MNTDVEFITLISCLRFYPAIAMPAWAMRMGLFKKKVEEQMDAAAEKIMERWLKESEQQKEGEQALTSMKSSENDGLWQMSMPELWKMALSLGISKKGSKDELIGRIQEAQTTGLQVEHDDKDIIKALEQLRNELSEYERIREGIKTRIESTSGLIPKLNEKKELLEKDISQKQQRIAEVTELLPKLEEEKESLQKGMQEKLEQKMILEKEIAEEKEKITEVTKIIPKLEKNKEDAQKGMKQNQEEILKLDKQINQIQSFQKYGLDLLSTLLYATKKSKE
jgi:hypothetical protein